MRAFTVTQVVLSFQQPISKRDSLRNRKALSPHQDGCWYSQVYSEMVHRPGTYCHTNWCFESAFTGWSQVECFIWPVCRIEAAFPQRTAYPTRHTFLLQPSTRSTNRGNSLAQCVWLCPGHHLPLNSGTQLWFPLGVKHGMDHVSTCEGRRKWRGWKEDSWKGKLCSFLPLNS